MDIQYFGGNCVKLSNKKASMVIDDNLVELGLKTKTQDNDISLCTSKDIKTNKGRFLVDGPGEYEVSEVSIKGIPARAHVDEKGQRATIYSVHFDGFSIAIVGHIYPELSDEQAENIGLVDVLIIPVGGNGYTLDATGATKIVKKLDPKIVIPTHYANPKLNYPVPQNTVDDFLKILGIQDISPEPLIKLKETDITDKLQVKILELASN